MADLKISQLGPFAEADVADTDVLALADISESQTKKISSADLVKAGARLSTDPITFGSDLVVTGDLTVNGSTTTIDTTTLVVEDKNIEIGKVATPTDETADGGGITLKGDTDKTISWVDATDAWTSSEHIDLASAKQYRIAGTKVLDATSLGSAVVDSSLTSVGTIGTGVWNGTAVGTAYGGTGQTTFTDGELLIGKTDGTLAKATLTAGTDISIVNADGAITINASGGSGLPLTGGTLTGALGIITGTQTAPSIFVSGDTNTGIYAPANDNLAITTAGQGRLFVHNTDKVGIGITPETLDSTATRGVLAVNSSASAAVWLGVGGAPKATFMHTGTNAILYNTATGYLGFGTSNQERLRIASTGEISTSNDVTLNAQADLRFGDSDSSHWVAFQAPATVTSNVTWTLPDADGSSGQVLSTDGSGTLSWATAASGATDKIEEGNTSAEVIDTGSDGRFVVTTEGSERLRIDSSGRLGLGTSSPDDILTVSGAPESSTDAVTTLIQSGINYRDVLRLESSAAANVAWNYLECDSAFIIDGTGQVGIGTTSPSYQLQLSTDSAAKPSTNTWTVASDERLKEDIELADLDQCYAAIKSIPLKRYKWKEEVYTAEQVPDRNKLGWIAQDVEQVFPKAVQSKEFKYGAEGNEVVIPDCRDLNADQLYAAMYGAIQKLIGKVETLEAEVQALKGA